MSDGKSVADVGRRRRDAHESGEQSEGENAAPSLAQIVAATCVHSRLKTQCRTCCHRLRSSATDPVVIAGDRFTIVNHYIVYSV